MLQYKGDIEPGRTQEKEIEKKRGKRSLNQLFADLALLEGGSKGNPKKIQEIFGKTYPYKSKKEKQYN